MPFLDSIKELKDIDFAELDVQQIGVWPTALKTLLVALILIAILILGYFVKVQEIRQQTQRAAQQETQLLQQYQSKAFLAANLDAYRQQMIELDKTFGALLKNEYIEKKISINWSYS